MVLDRVLRFFIILFLAVAGAALLDLASPVLTLFISTEILKMDMGIMRITVASLLCILLGAIIGMILGFFLSPYLIHKLKRFSTWVEVQIGKMPIHDALAGAIGLAIGLIIANLLGFAFAKIPIVGDYFPVIFSIVFGYLGIRLTIKKRAELTGLFDFLPRMTKEIIRMREARAAEGAVKAPAEAMGAARCEKAYKLLDTSVIIDGRIADLCDTGFIEGTLLIPVFVLEELQHIADSADQLKRTRGRRGLDILQRIRQEKKVKVEITNVDFEDIAEVDSKLVRLGQEVGGKIITNDFNLNKVAQLRGVEVLNINALANAVKPVVIPGEGMTVTIVKPGKEQGQGVAYLDDGTMIVIENGYRHIGETIEVEVTSALQTAAGRMIFAKPIR
ncbi:PIN/TRAM domain-containing protein [Mitsuokella sp. oral taxon 131]|uniref:PIN/TRAM domain-containing protein n=1 Tax=Mitsuokella sp. oral taxon 131 TaxID=1321780 RepID=UPI0003AE4CEA|nr:PIN/TRAM domain-containing protein [Mitsuokella sp. oral taxon 131]ERL25268.1 PIN domain protein [Mitsuokella sp. oral taxon 131 str. W9106]